MKCLMKKSIASVCVMRRVHITSIFIAFVLLMSPVMATGQNLFIMGWDGAGKKNVDALLSMRLLPNLQDFLDTGGVLMDIETYTQTATVAGWTTIFVGLPYEITGVAGNKPYDGGELEALNIWL